MIKVLFATLVLSTSIIFALPQASSPTHAQKVATIKRPPFDDGGAGDDDRSIVVNPSNFS